MIGKQPCFSAVSTRKSASIAVLVLVSVLSGCATPNRPTTAPLMPVPVSPRVAEALSNNNEVTFVWQSADKAFAYDFHVFNATNSDIDLYMRRDLSSSQICSGGSCSITLPLSLPSSERHAWRVRSVNGAGRSSWTRNLFTWVTR